MRYLTWVVSGLIGGLIGAVVWAVVVFLTDYELGIIAWGIGVLSGLGVRAAAGEAKGAGPAAVAALAAIIAVTVGKVGTAALILRPGALTEEHAIAQMSDVVIREYDREGRQVTWPPGVTWETAASEADYPADVWAEASSRWRAIPLAEQGRYLSDVSHLWLLDHEYVISYLADEVATEQEALGIELVWPSGSDPETRMNRDHYPPDVWKAALARWVELSPKEQRAFEEEQVLNVPAAALWLGATLYALSLWDLFWLGLATVSAWRVGSGLEKGQVAKKEEPSQQEELPPSPDSPDITPQ